MPPLAHGEKFARDGVGQMLSPEGFDMAWTQYQGYTVQRLNELTAGRPDEGTKVKDLIIKYARNADTATLFNYASMAHNNHFMFSTLTPTPKPPPKICSGNFLTNIDIAFSSFESLRETFLATAASMFGPGFTWLVKENPGQKMSILNTYLAGSPYPGAHWRKQPVDAATTDFGVIPNSNTGWAPSMSAGAVGKFSRGPPLAPGGANLDVLMCVSTWEHAWLRDWGVAGKREYLEAWWGSIDWRVVEANGGGAGSANTAARTRTY